MAYTHYWRMSGDIPQVIWDRIVRDARTLFKGLPAHSKSAGGYYADQPLDIGYSDCKDPIADSDKIWFNGRGGNDLSHDTFVFTRRAEEFTFCKTARKPYDLVVTAVLLLIKHHDRDGFVRRVSITSDGDPSDWEPAERLIKELFGYKVKFEE